MTSSDRHRLVTVQASDKQEALIPQFGRKAVPVQTVWIRDLFAGPPYILGNKGIWQSHFVRFYFY
jgi:hypothetical protein